MGYINARLTWELAQPEGEEERTVFQYTLNTDRFTDVQLAKLYPDVKVAGHSLGDANIKEGDRVREFCYSLASSMLQIRELENSRGEFIDSPIDSYRIRFEEDIREHTGLKSTLEDMLERTW